MLTVVNHARRKRTAQLEVMGPAAWDITPRALDMALPPRGQVERPVTVRVPEAAEAQRYVLTTDVVVEGERLGELFDAIVDVV
jgi:uncharacterized membrane protein